MEKNKANYPHKINPSEGKNRYNKPKNTVDFKPDYSEPNIRFMVGSPAWSKYPYKINPRDIVIVPGLCANITNYKELVDVIPDHVWKGWHSNPSIPEGTHWIADDKMNWKQHSPNFNKIIDRLSNYFQTDPKATRLNVYETIEEYKPQHKDRSALNEEASKTQNVTIGCNIGCERVIRFVTDEGKQKIDIPLIHGSVYLFGNKVNMENTHGIPPLKKYVRGIEPELKSRASIIIWGYSTLMEDD